MIRVEESTQWGKPKPLIQILYRITLIFLGLRMDFFFFVLFLRGGWFKTPHCLYNRDLVNVKKSVGVWF